MSTRFGLRTIEKVYRKSGFHLLSIPPKSSFGEHKRLSKTWPMPVESAWKPRAVIITEESTEDTKSNQRRLGNVGVLTDAVTVGCLCFDVVVIVLP